ncbi:hypothetical protein DICPUDRAFT_91988 [Dictyostelium purpureum]|uniref:Uncharacterized protein n=1 Tax=Dictyostelium purpureum TaxID=5786 RepID=F0ZK62_DICPU|nr:uncharacterized protein DICPUDRAFT_91988 [Dictyostelium purpureum]EGC35677.1 hypothetical protein DICPUDRAFT_91988 [Dictyostelium purpureum]|eukprot:XP_003287810.1 hypothetical protein DICPUDRAFT_91988 [Dictyostelium purpureum]
MESSIMNRNITLQSLQEQVETLEKRNQFLEKELEHYKNEVQSTRKILTERENLLLQLQWDENDAEIDADAQKKKRSKERVANEERQQIQRLRSQMKIMETALEERDTNIHKLHKELSDSKLNHQYTIEAITAGREAPQRSKTSWGFRSSPSSSPMVFKPSYSASPIGSEKHFTNAAPSPVNSPALGSPNFASSSTSGSPSMMEFDYNGHPKKLGKKGSIFNFRKSKSKSPIIQDNSWATQSAH